MYRSMHFITYFLCTLYFNKINSFSLFSRRWGAFTRQRRTYPRHQHDDISSYQSVNASDDDIIDDDIEYSDNDPYEVDYGKFILSDDDDILPPLPQFLNLQEGTISFPLNTAEETQKRLDEQQKQIEILMKVITSSKSEFLGEKSEMELLESRMESSPLPPFQDIATSQIAPIKIMLFIDGTWLYYSIYERPAHLCPIVARFGRGWQQKYNFNWNELPRIVCEAIQEQERQVGWGGNRQAIRHVEVTRASVFTSVKKNTSIMSDRIQMFEEMKASNYDVYMMETVGSGEKCIDIQLAVEMLHYATVPNAYDVAILVSGDKDFMPALIRTRQKARKVGIVSKRTDCNRALYQTPNLIDYDMIWFEDYLDRLISVKEGVQIEAISSTPDISRFTVLKVIYDFILKSNLPMVSSRDVGRYLKRFRIGKSDLQTELKRQFRGLHQIVRETGAFAISKVDSRTDKSFWISLTSNAEDQILRESQQARFNDIEDDFFRSYNLDMLDDREQAYEFSLLEQRKTTTLTSPVTDNSSEPKSKIDFEFELKSFSKPDYSLMKLVELKDLCRERGLAVSGTKALVISRLEAYDDTLKHGIENRVQMSHDPVNEYIVSLIQEYLQASGGVAGSRDLGRYLNANYSYAARRNGGVGNSTALTELKSKYGSLAKFINLNEEIFERSSAIDNDGNYEFQVRLK
jgi:uncharacterized LabA/DUF88 family protein